MIAYLKQHTKVIIVICAVLICFSLYFWNPLQIKKPLLFLFSGLTLTLFGAWLIPDNTK